MEASDATRTHPLFPIALVVTFSATSLGTRALLQHAPPRELAWRLVVAPLLCGALAYGTLAYVEHAARRDPSYAIPTKRTGRGMLASIWTALLVFVSLGRFFLPS